jgi:hypothetical protein
LQILQQGQTITGYRITPTGETLMQLSSTKKIGGIKGILVMVKKEKALRSANNNFAL